MEIDEKHKFWHCGISMGRRVRACTRLSEPAKALTTRDYVRGISGPSTLLNRNDEHIARVQVGGTEGEREATRPNASAISSRPG
jgi:hypothetical protein